MLVERLNRYFNKCLKVFVAEHKNNPGTAHEGLLMALFAWNCAPVPGTDISRCLLVTGREWHYPVDFSSDKHLELLSSPRSIRSFARRQAEVLSATRSIARILIDEHRAYHRELINSLRPDPLVFEPGDHVFARRTVQSSKKMNRVGKLEFAYTGPWEVIRRLKGASYECKHLSSGKIDKFYGAHLSPVPRELIPFTPVDGPDHRFGQLHKPLSPDAYKAAGIEGFATPLERFDFSNKKSYDETDSPPPSDEDNAVNPTLLIDFQSWPSTSADDDLHFPSLWELNQELHDYGDINLDDLVDGVQPISPQQLDHTYISKPTAATLASRLVSSKCKLFFISWSAPGSLRREWHLVHVNLASSIAYNPECLTNGKFLAEFFICHPHDADLHPRNQLYGGSSITLHPLSLDFIPAIIIFYAPILELMHMPRIDTSIHLLNG
jgi:hypothetical protein